MEAVIERTPASVASKGGRPNEGHGRRLTAAFEALENFPVLSESRNRVLRLVRERPDAVGDVVAAVESDVALVTTVLRVANRVAKNGRGKIASVPAAVEALTPEGVERLAAAGQRLRLLRAHPRLGRPARALPAARRGHPGGR